MTHGPLPRHKPRKRGHPVAALFAGVEMQRPPWALSICRAPILRWFQARTAGVDPKARRDFWDELHTLAARGITVLVSTHYMDEAERCHKLGYILNGQLLAQGTAHEVIASQSLSTWAVSGDDLAALAPRLKELPEVEQVAAFGSVLHVTGTDHD